MRLDEVMKDPRFTGAGREEQLGFLGNYYNGVLSQTEGDAEREDP
jgi:hypothetical protein